MISCRYSCVVFLLLLTTNSLFAAGPDAQTRQLVQTLGLKESAAPVRDNPAWEKPEQIVLGLPPSLPAATRDRYIASAKEIAGGVELIVTETRFYDLPDMDLVGDQQVFLGFCNPRLITAMKNLIWLQHYGSGVEHCLTEEVINKDFILTNLQHAASPPIAEHVMSMLFILARKMPELHALQLQGKWDDSPLRENPAMEIQGKTLLIAGLGGIGTEVAWRAQALGMRVLATRNSSREGPDFVDYVGLADELFELAEQADVIVNALPLTDKTTGLFDKHFFDRLKPGALFISVGRGQSTDTGALVAALKDGRLGGAGLDVTDPEPLPPGHALYTLPNVIITPHVASSSDSLYQRNWLIIRENLRRYINGERLLNVVDKARGY